MKGWLYVIGSLSTVFGLMALRGTSHVGDPEYNAPCVGYISGGSVFFWSLVLCVICAAMAAGLLKASEMAMYASIKGGLIIAGILMAIETVGYMFAVFGAKTVPCSAGFSDTTTLHFGVFQVIVAAIVAIMAFIAGSRTRT